MHGVPFYRTCVSDGGNDIGWKTVLAVSCMLTAVAFVANVLAGVIALVKLSRRDASTLSGANEKE